MLLAEIVEVSKAVTATRSRTEKTNLLAATLRRLSREEARVAVSYLAGRPTQRTIGLGYATVYGAQAEPAEEQSLELLEIDGVLSEISVTSGAGSKKHKDDLLTGLMARATAAEQEFLRGLILRNLRQGALEGVMAESVAAALDVPAERVRRAAMLEGDLVEVAARALSEGPETLGHSSLSLFTPLQPMLAKTAGSAADAVTELGEAVVEQKLDGLRVQVHRVGDRVAVYTRNLRDITSEMATVVQAVLDFPADRFILDGEALLIGADGTPHAFQDSMSRPGGESGWPLEAFYFDILHLDGTDLIDEPLAKRRKALEHTVPAPSRVGSTVTADPAVAEDFFAMTVAAGFEGVVVKDLSQEYQAGRRGTGWLKVKPVHTLDLVILAAEWGSGRREGWLSNLHLGARDPEGGFVMLGRPSRG